MSELSICPHCQQPQTGPARLAYCPHCFLRLPQTESTLDKAPDPQAAEAVDALLCSLQPENPSPQDLPAASTPAQHLPASSEIYTHIVCICCAAVLPYGSQICSTCQTDLSEPWI